MLHVNAPTDKLRDIAFIIADESHSIMNVISRVSELRLCVLTAAPFENRWWRFTANHRAGFTDEMRMRLIAQPYFWLQSLELHKIWILKKTSSKGAYSLLFGLKLILNMKLVWSLDHLW